MTVFNPGTGGAAPTDTVLNDPATVARNTITPGADFVPLTIKGRATQTADLLQVTDSATNMRLKVDINGNVTAGSNLLTIGGGSVFSQGQLVAASGAATQVSIGAVGPSGQSGITFQNGTVNMNLYYNGASTMQTDSLFLAAGLYSNAIVRANRGGSGNVDIGAVGPASENAISFVSGECFLYRSAANLLAIGSADLAVITVGKGLRVKEGTNAKQGVATLVAGTVTVSNTSVTATSRIILTAQDNNSTGALRVSARTAGTNFTITSSNVADVGVVAYEIFEQG